MQKNQWVTTNYIPNYEEGHIGGSPALDFQSYTRYMVYGDNEGSAVADIEWEIRCVLLLPMTFSDPYKVLME